MRVIKERTGSNYPYDMQWTICAGLSATEAVHPLEREKKMNAPRKERTSLANTLAWLPAFCLLRTFATEFACVKLRHLFRCTA